MYAVVYQTRGLYTAPKKHSLSLKRPRKKPELSDATDLDWSRRGRGLTASSDRKKETEPEKEAGGGGGEELQWPSQGGTQALRRALSGEGGALRGPSPFPPQCKPGRPCGGVARTWRGWEGRGTVA